MRKAAKKSEKRGRWARQGGKGRNIYIYFLRFEKGHSDPNPNMG